MLIRSPLSWLVRAVLAAALLALPLPATWSIILIDVRTGEIAVGSATCVPNFDLAQLTPVIVVGKGGATAQSYVDSTGRNRLLIFQGFQNGVAPSQILAALAMQDPGHQTRQYGIVDTRGRAVTFTGKNAGAFAGGVTGRIGDIAYAIQGNVITGKPVLDAAEAAVKTTRGDLGQKLMAAMEAAESMGGDGRCSCSSTCAYCCGSPPNKKWAKAAHIGFMIVARPGDTDGTCTARQGCANGSYYMRLNHAFKSGVDPAPVPALRKMFDAWRAALAGRPDHFLSTVDLPVGTLPDDGRTQVLARIVLRDVDGKPLTKGGAKVTVTHGSASQGRVAIGTVRDNGNGTYDVPLTGTQAGGVVLDVAVDDGKGPVLLGPPPRLDVVADSLWASTDTVSIADGAAVDLVVHPRRASRAYVLLAGLSGTSPGTRIGSLTLPLNLDPFTNLLLVGTIHGSLPGFLGWTDGRGRSTARLPLPPGMLGLPLGAKISLAGALLLPIDAVTNAVDLTVGR